MNKPHARRGRRPIYRSWRRSVFGLMSTALVVLAFYMLLSNAIIFTLSKRALQSSVRQTLEIGGGNVEIILGSVASHIKDLLHTVHNEPKLTSTVDSDRIVAQYNCRVAIESKLNFNSEIDCMFIYNTETGSIISEYNTGGFAASMLMDSLRQYLNDSESATICSPLNDDSWTVMRLGGLPVFYKAYKLDSFIIGAVSSVSYYETQIIGNQQDMCMAVLSEGELLYYGGYTENYDVFLENGQLATDDRNTIIASYPLKTVNASVYLLTEESSFNRVFNATFSALLLLPAVCIAFFLLTSMKLHSQVLRPTEELLRATERIEAGDYDYRVVEMPESAEFRALTENFNNMTSEIVNLKINDYERRIRDKENELQMLRAQIRPHFYVNAVTTLVNMTYQDRNEDIRHYLWALADYMRYMLKIRSKTVRVGEELDNVRAYLRMQEIKFPTSINVEISCQEAVENLHLPYLVLFTVVENAIKHAMNLYETLDISVSCRAVKQDVDSDFDGVCITVEDSGEGFPAEVLEQYSAENSQTFEEEDDHIGLSNVKRTLQLMYNRSDLLRLSNRQPKGARVEIWIPDTREERNEDEDADR